MPGVKDRPTKRDAEGALGMLEGELEEFPFDDDASKSVALSGWISPVVRPALDCVPLHALTAPTPGTGKSYLADLMASTAIGDAMPTISMGEREEFEKRLNAMIIEGTGIFSIDNVSRPLGGDELCQAIERPLYTPRILGKSEMKERRNNWCLYANGNNLRLRDDITRRVIRSGLDRKMERPELYKFAGDPVAKVRGDRGRYLWAILTSAVADNARRERGDLLARHPAPAARPGQTGAGPTRTYHKHRSAPLHRIRCSGALGSHAAAAADFTSTISTACGSASILRITS
jgi:hypothetical protein